MATEKIVLPIVSVASMVEEVLQQHKTRVSDVNLASRKAEEACMYNNVFPISIFSVI